LTRVLPIDIPSKRHCTTQQSQLLSLWTTSKTRLIRRWDTRTWRDLSLFCLLIYHWT